MADVFAGKHPGDPDPTVTRGPGIEAGAAPVFVGGQSGQANPTLQGYVKKRLPLGEGTVLDSQS